MLIREIIIPFRRNLVIERAKEDAPIVADHECELSFSSETDEVERRCYGSERDVLKSDMYREIIDHDHLDTGFLRTGGSLLKNHDPEQIIGAIVSTKTDKEGRRGKAKVRFTSTQAGKDAETEVNEGALRSVSFGYEHNPKQRKMIARGEKFNHYGRTIKGPAMLVGVRALEISLTPIPADMSVGIGRSKEEQKQENPAMLTAEMRKYIRKKAVEAKLGFRDIRDVEDAVPESEAEADALILGFVNDYGRTETRTAEPAQVITQAAPVTKTLNVSSVSIRCKEAGLNAEETLEVINAVKNDDEATVEIKTRKEKREKERGSIANPSSVTIGDETFEKKMRCIEGSLVETVYDEVVTSRPSCMELVKDGKEMRYVQRGRGDTLDPFVFERNSGAARAHEPEGDKDRDGGDEFSDYRNSFKPSERQRMDIVDAARLYFRAFGESWEDLLSTPKAALVQNLFSQEQYMRSLSRTSNRSMFKRDSGIAQGTTTASFPNLLQNVQNKILRRPYQRATPTWQRWCKKGSLKDFKPGSRIALSDAGDLILRKENAQPISANFSDETENIRLDDYSRRYNFTWEMMLSDDLGGMARNLLAISRSVYRLPSVVLTKSMLSASGLGPTMGDSVAWLDASAHTNYDSTSGGAFSATSLNTAITALRKQKGKIAPLDSETPIGGINDNLNLMPWGLLIPPDLILAVTKLLNPNYYANLVGDGGAGVGAQYFSGGTDGLPKLQVIVEPRLSNSSFTNYNATRWYLFSDPAENDHWEVAFLNGSDEPIIRTTQDFQNLGMSTTCHLPCGVAPLEWRTVQGQIGQ